MRPGDRLHFAVSAAIAGLTLVGGLLAYLTGAKLMGAELLLASQFFGGLAIQIKVSRRLVVYDIRVAFLSVYTLYGGAVGLSTLWGLGDVHGLTADDPALTRAVLLYAFGAFAFNGLQLMVPVSWQDGQTEPQILSQGARPLAVALPIIFLLWFYQTSVSTGAEIRLDVDRALREAAVGQDWVVTVFLLQGTWMYCFFKRRSFTVPSRIWLGLSFVICLLYFTLAAGSRRDMLPVLIFAVAVVLERKRAHFNWKVLTIVLVSLIGNLWLGIIRENKDQMKRDWNEEIKLALGNNEFSIPAQNLVIYLESENWAPKFGATYVIWPAYFIPRVWWADKPKSLSWSTLDDTGRAVPAFTPVVEAYINFLWLGPPLVIGLISVFCSWLVKRCHRISFLYYIALSLVFDFNRGEFGLTVYAVVFMVAGYLLTAIVSGDTLKQLGANRIPRSFGRT